MEHVLLGEIKKQEPYFEEEKRQIRLQFTPVDTIDTSKDVQQPLVFSILLKIDYHKKLLDIQNEDEIES
jgi:hypothetical protein